MSSIEDVISELYEVGVRLTKEQLESLVQQCKSIVDGVSPARLRTDVSFKTEMHGKMSELLAAIDLSLENLPRRKIRMS